MDLAELMYDLTEPLPRREHFGLAAQLRKPKLFHPVQCRGRHAAQNPRCKHHPFVLTRLHAELDTQ